MKELEESGQYGERRISAYVLFCPFKFHISELWMKLGYMDTSLNPLKSYGFLSINFLGDIKDSHKSHSSYIDIH